MKVNREQKIRIARFLTLNPSVTFSAVAELFDVSCSLISSIMYDNAFYDRDAWERYVNNVTEARLNGKKHDEVGRIR